jgi:hypothetical protein
MMDHDNNDESDDGDDVIDWGENDDDWGGGEVEIEDDDEDDNNDDDDEEEIEDKVMDKFILTFTNGNYDTEFDDELCTDQGVTLPVRPTQASYNKPDDWRERNRIGLEKVRTQLQNSITLATTDDQSFELELTHNRIGYQLVDNEEPIVWHESVLDEYWNQVEAKIDRRKQQELVTNILDIHIMNVEIKKERLAALVAMFVSGRATNSCDGVRFINTNLCEEGFVCLSKLVDVSSKLHNLTINHNRIDNMESALCLSRSLQSHACINRLYLNHCNLGSTPEILSVILQSDVKNFYLNNNNINSLGAVKIAEYLEDDPPIRRIDLDYNLLNDNDAVLISQALRRNTNLVTLLLYTNNFTSIGVKALLTSVYDGSSLNAISESNHTLESLMLFWYSGQNCKLDYYINKLLRLDRKQKIMLALQDKDSLLHYLANIPVELIPEVLAFPLRQVDNQCEHKYLNLVYSTMRWWNMPMLYSYHTCVKSDTKRKREMV